MENVLPFPVVVGLPDWIDSVRHLLAPPVGNKLLHGEGMHKVMVVGGPNTRSDYHIEIGEVGAACAVWWLSALTLPFLRRSCSCSWRAA
jgi:hypothetical protein